MKLSLWKQEPLFRAIFTINITAREKDFSVGVEGLKDVGFVGGACAETIQDLSDSW